MIKLEKIIYEKGKYKPSIKLENPIIRKIIDNPGVQLSTTEMIKLGMIQYDKKTDSFVLNEDQVDLIAKIQYLAQLDDMTSSEMLKVKQSIHAGKFILTGFDKDDNLLQVEL